MRAAAARFGLLFGLWVVLDMSVAPADLVLGALTAAGATWVSLRLLPPQLGRVSVFALCVRTPRFLWQSVRAAVDVAWRAFSPRMPLATGFVRYRTAFPPGAARNGFTTIASLLPGSLPCGEAGDDVEFHCLDVGQPVAEQLAVEERVLAGALKQGAPDA